ncbi:MAG: glycosyltransferase family 4 protein [Flavobacteriales bacterium]|nr:glycosyltransferase family 4 protein [Flavobacteriales bacterium]
MRLSGLALFNKKKIKKLRDFFVSHQVEIVLFNGSNDIKAGGQAAFQAQVPRRIYWRGIALAPKNSWINRRVFRDFLTDVIANSEETKQLILSTLGKVISPERIHVVYNGINFDDFDNQADIGEVFPDPGDKIVIGNAARLTPQKNFKDLILVAQELKNRGRNFEVWIAGEGAQLEQIRHWIKKYNVEDNVVMLGFISNVKAFMERIDILVFPSLWEGFGFTLVEAMACGKPIVAYNISSNPEIVVHGQTGVLIQPGDIASFTDAVDEFVSSPEQCQLFGEKGREHARSQFNLSTSVDRFELYVCGPLESENITSTQATT